MDTEYTGEMNNKPAIDVDDLFAHGDALFVRISELPKDAKEKERGERIIVAHSESGHHHQVVTPGVEAVLYASDEPWRTYLHIPATQARLVHLKGGPDAHGPYNIHKRLRGDDAPVPLNDSPGDDIIFSIFRQDEKFPSGWEKARD